MVILCSFCLRWFCSCHQTKNKKGWNISKASLSYRKKIQIKVNQRFLTNAAMKDNFSSVVTVQSYFPKFSESRSIQHIIVVDLQLICWTHCLGLSCWEAAAWSLPIVHDPVTQRFDRDNLAPWRHRFEKINMLTSHILLQEKERLWRDLS